jgi:hypothetical protein
MTAGLQRKEGSAPQGGPPEDGEAAPPRDERQRRRRLRFTVPESVRVSKNDPKTIVMAELKLGEIDAAYELGAGNRNRTTQELTKLALYKIDGKVVGVEDVEERWPTFSQKVRMQIATAYNSMHNTSDAEDQAFLGSAVADEYRRRPSSGRTGAPSGAS